MKFSLRNILNQIKIAGTYFLYIVKIQTHMKAEIDPKEINGKPEQETNNPNEAMDTPEKIEESNDEKTDEDFPGYPHYPAEEDILNPGNESGRVDLDVENLTRSHTISVDYMKSIEGTPAVEPDFTQVPEDEDDEIEIVPGTEADVTAEDLVILGARDEDMDLGEDEELKARGWQPMIGKDLDVPNGDDEQEIEGQEDEENSYYSLGGDEMEKLRESNDQNNF